MEPTDDELIITERHTTVKGEKIDHRGIMYHKPWGKECLVCQTKDTAVWLLNIKADQSTSLHCHFKKDTVLIGVDGCAKIGLGITGSRMDLHPLQSIVVPARKFHSVGAFGSDVWVLEIEVFGEERFSNKNDLFRLDDAFNRPRTGYETSVTPSMHGLELPLNINGTRITRHLGQINFLLSGIVREGSYFGPGSQVSSGDVISLTRPGASTDTKIIWGSDHLRVKNLSNVVMTSGCFDILHAGHIKVLQEAAELGPLLVCLSSDEQIRRLKGHSRPVNTLRDRLQVIKSLECVSWVLVYDETDDETEEELDRLIKIVSPRVWVKGSEYSRSLVFHKHPTLRDIHLVEMMPGVSTTSILTTHREHQTREVV